MGSRTTQPNPGPLPYAGSRGSAAWRMAEMNMDSGTNISALYREIHRTCSWGMWRCGAWRRLARAHAALKSHADYSDAGYLSAVEAAFNNWEAMQKTGR